MGNIDQVKMFLAKVPNIGREELVARWTLEFGSPPHPKLRIELMRPVLAYRTQENASGLPKQRVRERLQDAILGASVTPFKSGTRIVREWNGEIHEVSVSDDGYEYRGERFKSLSPIATKITGTKWSGPAFFGTKPKARSK
jgi:hypothetical protein